MRHFVSKSIFTLLSLILLNFLITSCALNNKDIPVNHLAQYPPSLFMTGVGSSEKGANEADDAARMDLLKQIEVEITGEETTVQAESSKSGLSSSYVQSRIDSKVHIIVPGLTIKERWNDLSPNRFYSLAVINREEAAENIFRKIEELNIEIENLIHAGEEAETHRDYNNALNYYKDAAERIKTAQMMVQPYRVIKGGTAVQNAWSFEDKSAGIKARINRISDKLPKAGEITTYDEGIRDIVIQLIRRLPAGELLTLSVGEFREGNSGGRIPLSNILESDIRTTMAGVEDIKVLDGNSTDSDLVITALFRLDKGILRINAVMKNKKTDAIISAGRVLIQHPPTLTEEGMTEDGKNTASMTDSYSLAVEQTLTAENSTSPFDIKVWADKDRFRINEPIVFYFKSDADCYLTLLDQGTSGTLRVLFPNPYQRDNLIHNGRTYSVPDPYADYEIKVDGPAGIERVKAICTPDKSTIPVDTSKGFYEFTPQDNTRTRDLNISVKRLEDQQWAQGYLEITITSDEDNKGWRPRKIK